jgi:hypothetical protein
LPPVITCSKIDGTFKIHPQSKLNLFQIYTAVFPRKSGVSVAAIAPISLNDNAPIPAKISCLRESVITTLAAEVRLQQGKVRTLIFAVPVRGLPIGACKRYELQYSHAQNRRIRTILEDTAITRTYESDSEKATFARCGRRRVAFVRGQGVDANLLRAGPLPYRPSR